MKTISTAVKNMIDSGRMVNPSCRLITDIDPPFVGLDTLMEDAAYPYLYESDGITYLSVVKSAGIFIYRVDDFEKRALTLVHSITAANVKNARIAFDGAKYHAVWENGADGKIYVYNGITTAELATGKYPDILYCSAIYYLWAGSNGIYQKTGDQTEVIAEIAEGETIKGLRVFLLPDGTFLPIYVIETAERDEIRVASPEIVKTIHTANKGTLDRLQGSFTGNNIYLSWYQNGIVFGKALYDVESLKETVEKAKYIDELVDGVDITSKTVFGLSPAKLTYNQWEDGSPLTVAGMVYKKGMAMYGSGNYPQLVLKGNLRRFKRLEAFCGKDSVKGGANPIFQMSLTYAGDLFSEQITTPKHISVNLSSWELGLTFEALYNPQQTYAVWADLKLIYDYTFYNFEKARWTAATQFCTNYGDGLPVFHISNGEPDLIVFERNGNLVCCPKILQSTIQSADCTLTTKLESGSFGVDFVNRSGQFSKGDLSQLFDGEKTLGLEIGYNGEFVRIATSQVDSDNANRSRAGGIFSIDTKNKFYDLIQLPVTRNYGRRFNIGSKTMMISGYSLTDEIAAGGIAEVRIDAPNGKRWIPGSVEIGNLTNGVVAGPVYGQTEFFAFVRLTNTTEEAITPTFDVSAEDCTGLARKVGQSVKVTGEEKTLTGTTAVRLTNKSADNSQVQFVTVTDVDGKPYSNGDDYTLDVDSDGYTTIARAAESTIPDGATVKVSYTYISTFTFSLTFDNEKSKQDFYELASLSQPESYQIVITSVTGKTIDNYYQTYRPLHIFYAAAVNGAGVQIVLNDNASLTVNFEIWSRPMEKDQPFGYYWTVDEIFKDLAKHAAYKDVKFYEYEGKLEAGQFTSLDDNGKDLFVLMEEGFDIDTLRVENTGTDDVNVSIIEAGYIVDNDNRQNWGVRIAVTRAAYSGIKISYSFQLWGQYTSRKDFLPHFPIALAELPQTQLTKPLKVKDISIEEAAKKALQICFFDGVPFRMFAGARGEWTFKPHKGGRLDEIAHAFHVRNMAQIVWKRKTPLVIDRVEIKGSISESYLVASEMELAYNQASEAVVPAKTAHLHLTINFDKLYDMNSYEFRNIWTDHAHPEIILKTPNSVEVRIHNDSKHWLYGNNYKAGKTKFEIWGLPLNTANYQEDYIHKTNPGAGGRFNYTEAKVENELIADATIAGMVADQVITESCQDALEMQLRYCPANPALEQLDTCLVEFDEITDSAKGLIEEINFRFDASGGAPELTMGVKLVPRLPFAAGFGSENLSCYADDGLNADYELGETRDDSRELLNLIFG